MRFIRFEIGGDASAGDVVCLTYSAKRGGKTTAAHIVRAGESLDDIATDLGFAINTHWVAGMFEASAQGAVVSVKAADGVDDVAYDWYVEHVVGGNALIREPGGTETVTITEL